MDKMKLATIAIMVIVIGWIVWIVRFDDNGTSEKDSIIDDFINVDSKNHVTIEGEIRGIWLSYIDLAPMLTDKTEGEFTKNIQGAFEEIKGFGFNTVIVQVRPFSDALYESKYFPWSYICSGKEGQSIQYDPLEIMVKEAHKRGLRIEAWINPYRVRTATAKVEVGDSNPAFKWMNEESDSVIQYKGGIYYNPGKEDVRQLIVNGVSEIVENYNVDGIHFDDYFYPGTESSIDEESFGEYLLNGGKLSLEDWRRENVNILVRQVYEAVKKIDSEVLFGISPQGSMNNNYSDQYIEVEKWVQNKGYIDYICPQVYYGFENESSDYLSTVEAFDNLVTEPTVQLYIGLAGYKIATEDQWAGAGATEWITSEDMLKRQVEAARNLKKCQGIFVYRYDSLFNPAESVSRQVNSELENLKKAF